jgi:hypothetical protein
VNSARDYAYGFNGCWLLPRKLLDRSCQPYASWSKEPQCPDSNGKEGICPEKFSGGNADTYSFVAAGVYFSTKCARAIPYPKLPTALDFPSTESPAPTNSSEAPTNSLPVFTFVPDPTSEQSSTPLATDASVLIPRKYSRDRGDEARDKRDECRAHDDFIVIDGPLYDVQGYVHFGDSYAAGMGTGKTSQDACRIGENNYGDLMYKSWGNSEIPFEKKVCSGDTTTGLNRQIDEWNDPGKANVGTLTIGGNDIGFYDLVWWCVITPNTIHWGSTARGYCLDAERKAQDLMKDEGENGLKAKLKSAYLKVLEKSGRKVSRCSTPSIPKNSIDLIFRTLIFS